MDLSERTNLPESKSMKHTVVGFLADEEFPCYEREIRVSVSDLTVLMEWEDESWVVCDYRLDEHKIRKIKQACNVQFPEDLELFLMTTA